MPHTAWKTEVWIAEMPEHMIHYNGERFLMRNKGDFRGTPPAGGFAPYYLSPGQGAPIPE
jgi:hypothetical protein